jgi:hypothetical protein
MDLLQAALSSPESTRALANMAALVLLSIRSRYALEASPRHARDCSRSLRCLVEKRKALLDIAHLVGVLPRRRRVESDARSSVLAVLFARVGCGASCEAARGTADRCSNVPLALLCEPPEYSRGDYVYVSP